MAGCTSKKREIKGKRRGRGVRCLTRAAAMPGCVARDLPPVAFARIRACWYASAAMSETNFCAARDKRRFLFASRYHIYHIYQKRGSGGGQELAEQKRTMGDGRTIASLHIRNLLSGGNNPLLHQVSIDNTSQHERSPKRSKTEKKTHQRLVIIQHQQELSESLVFSCFLSQLPRAAALGGLLRRRRRRRWRTCLRRGTLPLLVRGG